MEDGRTLKQVSLFFVFFVKIHGSFAMWFNVCFCVVEKKPIDFLDFFKRVLKMRNHFFARNPLSFLGKVFHEP